MFDLENVDIMLENYSRNDEANEQNNSDTNLDAESNRIQQISNLVGEDFRSLPNRNSRENYDMTVETTRKISDVITSHQ